MPFNTNGHFYSCLDKIRHIPLIGSEKSGKKKSTGNHQGNSKQFW